MCLLDYLDRGWGASILLTQGANISLSACIGFGDAARAKAAGELGSGMIERCVVEALTLPRSRSTMT